MKTKLMSIIALGALSVGALQSCTHDVDAYVEPPITDQDLYNNADAVNGSKLFSNLQHVDAGWPAVSQSDIDNDASLAGLLGWPNPKYAADPTINIKDIANPPSGTEQKNRLFYTCMGCHPADGMGRDEIGNNKKVAIAQPDFAQVHLKDSKNLDITTLFNKIKNVGGAPIDPTRTANGLDLSLGGQNHPDFSKILTDDKIWDLVKYLKEGAIYNENGDLYTTTTVGVYEVPQTVPAPYALFSNLGGVDGDEAAGIAYYNAKCLYCHGANGWGTTDAQGPILAPGQKNDTGKSNATDPTTGIRYYGVGPFMRYRTPDGMLKVMAGQFGTIPWMGATPVTRKEMKDLLKAFSNTARFPNFATALPNP